MEKLNKVAEIEVRARARRLDGTKLFRSLGTDRAGVALGKGDEGAVVAEGMVARSFVWLRAAGTTNDALLAPRRGRWLENSVEVRGGRGAQGWLPMLDDVDFDFDGEQGDCEDCDVGRTVLCDSPGYSEVHQKNGQPEPEHVGGRRHPDRQLEGCVVFDVMSGSFAVR